MSACRDVATITEGCTDRENGVAELEVFSLISDQVPHYKLRAHLSPADTQEYENADWFVGFPALNEKQVPDNISHELIEAVLSFFVLGGVRISKMTKTYSDIEAVTRLLEEKEKDVELAAKIGQQLLERNKQMEDRMSVLETELQTSNEAVTQLKHDLHVKTQLLQIYSDDVEESGSEAGTPGGAGMSGGAAGLLRDRISQLERENCQLRTEFIDLDVSTTALEHREQDLVNDVAAQLSEANETIRSLSDELAARCEDSVKHQEQTTNLLTQLADYQARCKRLMCDNEQLHGCQTVSRDTQAQLTAELADLKDQYILLQAMFRDAQQHIRLHDKQSRVVGVSVMSLPVMDDSKQRHHAHHQPALLPHHQYEQQQQPESLASELERHRALANCSPDSGLWPTSCNRNLAHSPISTASGMCHVRSVFDTVRVLSGHSACHVVSSQPPVHAGVWSRLSSEAGTQLARHHRGDEAADNDDCSVDLDLEENELNVIFGRGDALGSDSEIAVSGGGEWRARGSSESRRGSDSVMSATCDCHSGYSSSSLSRFSHTADSASSANTQTGGWRLSEKLQIVKPMAGSAALQHWSRLATPTQLAPPGGVLHTSRASGVACRVSQRPARAPITEHASHSVHAGVCCEWGSASRTQTRAVFTLTNCTVLHPSNRPACDVINTSSSTAVSTLSSCTSLSVTSSSVAVNTVSHTSHAFTSGGGAATLTGPNSRVDATCTFSTSKALARALHERVPAVSLHQQSHRQSRDSGTCDTPCNSPDASRPASRTASHDITDSSVHCSASSSTHTTDSGVDSGGGESASIGELLRRALFCVGVGPRPVLPLAPSCASFKRRSCYASEQGSVLNRSVRRQMSLLDRLERLGLQDAVTVIQQQGDTSRSGVLTRRLPSHLTHLGTVPACMSSRPRAKHALKQQSSTTASSSSHLSSSMSCVGSVGLMNMGRKGGYL